MFGSQALETAIGLALLFFVLATAASALVEAVGKVLRKRHKDLELAIEGMLRGEPFTWSGSERVDDAFRRTTVYRAAEVSAGKAGVAYLSAASFADAAVELARTAQNVPPGLMERMEQIRLDAGNDLLAVKAGLETWFDGTMGNLENQYKRWATTWLFFAGFAIAVATNASAIHVASDLWQDTTTRAAVVAAAEGIVTEGQDAATIKDFATTADELAELKIPVGWEKPPWEEPPPVGWWLPRAVGWAMTGALLMLGAPFWFDLLGRLVSLRNAGKAPASAADDPASATAQRAVVLARSPASVSPPTAPSATPVDGSTMTSELAALLNREPPLTPAEATPPPTPNAPSNPPTDPAVRQVRGPFGRLAGR